MQQNYLQETDYYLLTQLCKLLRGHAFHLLDDLSLHPGQDILLICLWQQEGITQSELAEQLQVKPATVSNALGRMEKQGLLERRPSATDQRISHVFLTEDGRDLCPQVEQVWKKVEKQIFSEFSPQERFLLHRLLVQAHLNLGWSDEN